MNTDNPSRYLPNKVFKEQPIETMWRSMTPEAFEGYCAGNVQKYLMRYRSKGGDEDLDKAIMYIEFIRCAYHGESPLFALREKN